MAFESGGGGGKPPKKPPAPPATNPSRPPTAKELTEKYPKHFAPLTKEERQKNPWLGFRGKYGEVFTPEEWAGLPLDLKRAYGNYNAGYTLIPGEQAGPAASSPRRYGGGGGGGLPPMPPAPPPMKIRTTIGQRLTPYWQSEQPFIGGWQPRYTILGNTQYWG